MKYYELTYFISPDLSAEELKSLSSKISGFIKEEEGNLKETSEPIRKKLGSPIKKKGEVFLVNLNFYLNPEKLKNLEKKLKEEDKILRYLIITKKEITKAPAPRRIIKPAIVKETEETPEGPRPQIEGGAYGADKKVELKEIDKKIEEILNE